MLENEDAAAHLVETLQLHAEPGFLWVALAVKDFRRGSSKSDDCELLRRRLGNHPKELSAFLDRMFQSIDPINQRIATCVLLVVVNTPSHHPPYVVELSYLEEAMDNPHSASTAPFRKISRDKLSSRLERTMHCLENWWRGLVEVRRCSTPREESFQITACFNHLAIADFVREKVKSGDLSKMTGPSFVQDLTKCRMLLSFLKHLKTGECILGVARALLLKFPRHFIG